MAERPMVCHPDIPWEELFLSIGKRKRKTIGFGTYFKKEKYYEDEIYIRELPMIEAGIGCSVWDAAVILSRWIYQHNDVFVKKNILELGSGVGLPGILCSKYGARVVLTDYIDSLIENLKYNLWLNSNTDLDEEDGNELERNRKVQLKANLKESSQVLFLDWDNLQDSPADEKIGCKSMDIIIGSELIYTANNHHMRSLKAVIDRYLRDDGVFYSIQSTDRDGMNKFVDLMSQEYSVQISSPSPHLLGNYTGSRQRPESYLFYSMKRSADSLYPDMR